MAKRDVDPDADIGFGTSAKRGRNLQNIRVRVHLKLIYHSLIVAIRKLEPAVIYV